MLIYSEKITPRVQYAFKLYFKCILNLEYKLTMNWEDFIAYEGPKLNYSKKKLEGVLQFYPVDLLFENDIFEQELFVSKFNDLPSFFQVSSSSVWPFDPFAAAFYLVSRYEEYLPHITDAHDRFLPEDSLAFKHGFLKKPLVNIWAQHLRRTLEVMYPDLKFLEREFKFISTVDVDNLYAYIGKGAFRTFGGILKDILKFDFSELSLRIKCLLGFEKDPYFTFDFQQQLRDKYGFESIYFILFSDFGPYDRNVPMYSPKMHEAVRSFNDFCTIGIHPSYQSNDKLSILENEILSLGRTLRGPIKHSRQHFLKMKMPNTFRQLTELGIEHEYSMGYASEVGFRASICSPYPFYDLEMEVELPLTMHPFAAMDGTLIYYKQFLPEESLEEILEVVREVKAVKGELITIWHNRIYSEKESIWKGWNWVYEEMVKEAVS